MTERPVYRVRDLQKHHGSTFTLDMQDWDVGRHETLGLIGPTGAGKSTLLRLLAGLGKPDSGTIQFDGSPLLATELPLKTRRRIAMVHQAPLLLTGNVRFNVEYGLRLRGKRDCSEKVQAVLDRLGLQKLAGQSAQTLSGGQTQLVALARALVIEPDVLLLDEPTAHLDPASVAKVEETIEQFQQTGGMTVVWATHNLFQVRRVANRTTLLLNGQLVETALTEQLFTNPTDSQTADFVAGRMVY